MNNYDQEYEKNMKLQQKILEIESIAKKYMSSESILRYGALKSAHQQKAIQAITLVAQLGLQNEIKEKVSDDQFKQLLLSLDSVKKETRIIRK